MTTPALDTEEILREYRSGGSLRQIADAHGCSHVTIYRLLRGLNEPMHPSHRHAPQRRPTLWTECALALHKTGHSPEEIARKLRRSSRWVEEVIARSAGSGG